MWVVTEIGEVVNLGMVVKLVVVNTGALIGYVNSDEVIEIAKDGQRALELIRRSMPPQEAYLDLQALLARGVHTPERPPAIPKDFEEDGGKRNI